MNECDRPDLVAAVDEIAPIIDAHRDVTEAGGKLAPEVVDALKRAGCTRLFAPKSRGGEEADPVTTSLVVEALARHDTAAAWFVMVANASRLMGARVPDSLFERLWGDDIDTVVAASGNAPFRATSVEGGFRASGTNGFVSGVHHAKWLLSPMLAGDEMRVGFFRTDECTIEDNWHVIGMRGSGSNDVSVDDCFVPMEQTVAPAEQAELNTFCRDVALYRCPGRIVFATYVPVALALAEAGLEETTRLAIEKTPYATPSKLRDRSIAQIKYGRALATYRAARGYYFDAMAETWARAKAGHAATDTQKADLYLAGTHAVQSSADAVRLVADVCGTTAIYDASKLQRIVRDMEVIRHHGFANESRYGSVAQQLWGAELDYPLMLR